MNEVFTLICKDGSSNKFWSHEIIGDGSAVKIRWGRVGLAGRFQVKKFATRSACNSFVMKKRDAKISKGYEPVNDDKLEKERKLADDIGFRNKVMRIEYAKRSKSGDSFDFLTRYDPSKGIVVEVMDSWSKERTHFYLTREESFTLVGTAEGGRRISASRVSSVYGDERRLAQGVRTYLTELAQKVAKVLSQTFAAVGVRSFDDAGGGEVATFDYAGFAEEAGASSQVVGKFAALGARKLEL